MKHVKIKEIETPFLGVAYYPEDWSEEEIDRDISKMKEAGIKCARIAEFAWSVMEPEAGRFDFSFFRKVIDKLDKADIRVVLGTPTATPPIWLSKAYPDVMLDTTWHVRLRHGGRRHCCTNHPKYFEHSMRIVEEMGKAFGDDPRVIGWQIDNEITVQDCHCSYCEKGFQKYLSEKYGTIEALNEKWTTNIFSQTYSDFDEIPLPENAWHNPHIRLEWNLFQSRVQSDFVGAQIDILKKYTTAPIGTDTMPTNRTDYETLTEKCDIMQYNHYDTPQNLPIQRFWFDFMRPQKAHPFWNTETSTCWNGSHETAHSIKPYGFCRVNSWLPVAFGGEANMYWLWRTHHAGHEMAHGAVLSASGRPMHIYEEVKRVAEEFEKCADFLNGTKVETPIAFHFTSLAWNIVETQPLVKDFKYYPTVYTHVYAPMADLGLRADVIGARKDLSKYKLLVTPILRSLEEGDLAERIEAWVKAGGVWIVGPMTDSRNAHGAQYTHAPYGVLESLAGVRQAYEFPDTVGATKCNWSDGESFEGNYRYEVFEADGDELVTVTDGYPTLIGKAVVVKKKVGKGVVYVLGTVPSERDMKKLVGLAVKEAGIALPKTEGKLALVPRTGKKNGLIVLECAGESGAVTVGKEATDLLTGKKYVGKTPIAPYEILVLEED